MRFEGTMRRGLTGTATAVAAMAALTASQAPGLAGGATAGDLKNVASDDVVWTEVPNDDSYHTELPPLRSPEPPKDAAKKKQKPAETVTQSWAEAGIPATVLAAYRNAQSVLGRRDPGCRLPWQLLAAIGKVESGHAGGGRVNAAGTTLTPILGPVLNGAGFAHIPDTDGGAYDGDATYDRAVGPMQFIPSTWAHWGKDGNGDGRKDPNNVVDAALAAGHYLCAGNRNLSVRGDLDRAVLSYNHSETYLRTVLSWLDFYRKGVHSVADGKGVIPKSPGAGGPHAPKAPVGGPGSPSDPGHGGGIIVGPQPSATPTPSTSPTPTPTATDSGSPGPTPELGAFGRHRERR
ncbi:lytic transglycosylase domain-containing protein, partial [Streptomyces sp. SM10]|uniref:lytic transglycosylase domain-containing protein n=1 Tax=Streptomyces sp. SM10 TaxID=565556 RepID=UPI000CD59F5A